MESVNFDWHAEPPVRGCPWHLGRSSESIYDDSECSESDANWQSQHWQQVLFDLFDLVTVDLTRTATATDAQIRSGIGISCPPRLSVRFPLVRRNGLGIRVRGGRTGRAGALSSGIISAR